MIYKNKLLVFVGPDGSGKTTAINKIRASLSSTNQVQVNHIRFNHIPRAGQLKNFIVSLFKLEVTSIPKATVSEVDEPITQYIYPDNVPLFKILVLMCYEVFDYIIGYLTLYSRSNNKIIVFDRYIYDYYTEKHWSNTPTSFMRILMKLAPKPDFIFFMHNEPMVINSRKNELSVEDIVLVSERIKTLLNKEENLVVIDTSKSINQITDEIIALLKK
jgi:thymidylate kinase